MKLMNDLERFMHMRDLWKIPIAIGCITCVAIAKIFCGQRHSLEQWERKQRHQSNDSPEPLPPARRCALTLMSPEIATSPQQSLVFFKLPPDTRLLIYQHVLLHRGWLPTCTAPTGDCVASHAMSPASSMAGSIHIGGMQQVME